MTLLREANTLLSWKLWAPAIIASLFLLLIAQFSFLFFHTLAELFSIIVSYVMFAFAWSTRHFVRNNFLLFLACGYFWVGSLDLLHTLTYKGMHLLDEVSLHDDIAVQFWIGTRYLEAVILFLAPFAATRHIPEKLLFIAFGVASAVIGIFVFRDLFPTTYIEGQGLTEFKIYSEYLIDLVLLLALAVLYSVGNTIPHQERQLIAASIILTILAELAFTFYVSLYGLSNLVGHLFKLCSYWLIFNAIIISNIRKPYADLTASEKRFRSLFENNEVALWNVDLSGVNRGLKVLRKRGVQDLRQYLHQNRDIAPALADTIHITDVNTASYELFSAASDLKPTEKSEQLMRSLPMSLFVDQLCSIWEQQPNIRNEAILKNFNGEEITAIISFQTPETDHEFSNVPVSVVDITQRKQDEQKIWIQANFDSLTGLANRSYFADKLTNTIDLAERNGDTFTLLYIDLDRFKQVNDTLGHSVGDSLLQEASSRLKEHSRKTDVLARLAGDEFALLLANTSKPKHTEPMVVKLLQSLSNPYNLNGSEALISASIGIAIYPADGDDAQSLLRNADSAMYKAKESGRNNYHFFTEEIEKEIVRKREMEKDLRRAILHEEFTLHYQPIQDFKGNVVAAEALIRWEHPDRGLVSPIEFIPFAEEINLIAPLGEWILKQACSDAKVWSETMDKPPHVAVNISTRQFQLQNIPALVQEALSATQLPAELLKLEITESLMIEDDDSTMQQFQQLHSMGIALAVDDFGTGYSSLSYLKKFPLSFLKIDRAFVNDLPDSQEDGALIRAIISMAESLDLEVVAEGVETQAQVDFLKVHQCNYIQGYLLSKPLPFKAFLEYLSSDQLNSN